MLDSKYTQTIISFLKYMLKPINPELLASILAENDDPNTELKDLTNYRIAIVCLVDNGELALNSAWKVYIP